MRNPRAGPARRLSPTLDSLEQLLGDYLKQRHLEKVSTMSRSDLLRAFGLILFVSLPVAAQTSGELRTKYRPTSAVESFEVRPEIIATVFYGENGQAVEVLIEHRLSSTTDSTRDEMPHKMFEELLEEFAPVAKRGHLCFEASEFQSGRNHYVTTTYENVSIYSVEHDTELDRATASMAQIRWEKVHCKVKAAGNETPK